MTIQACLILLLECEEKLTKVETEMDLLGWDNDTLEARRLRERCARLRQKIERHNK